MSEARLSIRKPAGSNLGTTHSAQQCRRGPCRLSKASLRPRASANTNNVMSAAVETYNKKMAEKMGWTALDNPYEYHPERGLYYHFITEDLIVGSQPRAADDIRHLALAEGVQAIINLQQDKDMHHWGVRLDDLMHAAHEHDVAFVRAPAVDFDPNSLRAMLPTAVASLERARLEHGRVYVHCTAGLGRAPAVAIARLYWMTDMQLEEAYAYLTGIRPCGPNRDAIRGATYDLLQPGAHWEGFHHLPGHAFATLSSADREVIRSKLLGNS